MRILKRAFGAGFLLQTYIEVKFDICIFWKICNLMLVSDDEVFILDPGILKIGSHGPEVDQRLTLEWLAPRY